MVKYSVEFKPKALKDLKASPKEFRQLQEAMEDLEDLRDLRQAKAESINQPSVSLVEARRQLDLS